MVEILEKIAELYKNSKLNNQTEVQAQIVTSDKKYYLRKVNINELKLNYSICECDRPCDCHEDCVY